jgi:hypothetical protein
VDIYDCRAYRVWVVRVLIRADFSALCTWIGMEQEECLFDDINSGTKVSGSFQVSTGGFLDIDAKVPCPTLSQRPPTQIKRILCDLKKSCSPL